MSTSNEIEQLQSKKTRLEEESRSLTEQQGKLEEQVKVLEEKIAIEQLTNNNKATQGSISKLEAKIQGLEQKLSEVSQEQHVPHEDEQTIPSPVDAPQETAAAPQAAENVTEDSEEDFVVAAPAEPVMAEQEALGDSKKAHDRKKRKFF